MSVMPTGFWKNPTVNPLPIGVILPWYIDTVPDNWLELRGQAIDPGVYGQLAALHPGAILPDLRASFVRGADEGRGIDPARVLLSAQARAIMSHKHHNGNGDEFQNAGWHGTDNWRAKGGGTGQLPYTSHACTAASGTNAAVYLTGGDSAPENLAFMYITKALE